MAFGEVDQPSSPRSTPANPLSLYGVHKFASEKYLSIYHQNFGLPTIALRITNPYGPRQQIHHNRYCMVGWFIRQALEGRTIRSSATARSGATTSTSTTWPRGSCAARWRADGARRRGQHRLRRRARASATWCRRWSTSSAAARIEFVPWPEDYAKLETGDVVADLSLLRRLTGWHSQRRSAHRHRAHRRILPPQLEPLARRTAQHRAWRGDDRASDA